MREWFQNVYGIKVGGVPYLGTPSDCRQKANFSATNMQNPTAGHLTRAGVVCRLRVRLKPEGAPRRYASEANRRAWEERPRQAKALAEVGMQACLEDDGLIYDPRYL